MRSSFLSARCYTLEFILEMPAGLQTLESIKWLDITAFLLLLYCSIKLRDTNRALKFTLQASHHVLFDTIVGAYLEPERNIIVRLSVSTA